VKKELGLLSVAVLVLVLVAAVIADITPSPSGLDGQVAEITTRDWCRSINYTGIMTRVSSRSDPGLIYADEALDNIIHVGSGYEPYRYEDEIDWEVDGKWATWYVYFQSLRVVGYLANAAEVSGNVSYADKAAEIIESWFDFHHDNKKPPAYAWFDHSVANRCRNVMHFLRACQSLPGAHFPDLFFEKIRTMLCQHGDWLLQERNYHPNNHGLMASMALIQLAVTFPELDDGGLWKETGISRIRERIEADLSEENVHLEQTAFYHLFFLDLILQIQEYLDAQGVPLFQPGDNTIEEMKQYVAYMVKPNCHLPMIGDTSDASLANDYGHPWIAYSLSSGEEGTRPPNSSIVYPDAGVAILRDEWKTEADSLNTTYIFFQSAFHSTTHKHADDLGFVLYSHGEDILVGPGVYAYDSSKYRRYVRSAQAHNTLAADGRSYTLSSDNIGKANITTYRLEETFDFVQGSHSLYEDVTLTRGIVLIRPNTILIIDEATTETEHSIQQIWNLSPAAHDLEFDGSGASFVVGEDGVVVEIRQLGPMIGLDHYYGQEEPVRGFISPQQRQLVPVHQLEFESDGSGVVFVTQITVAGPGEDVPTIDVDPSNPYGDVLVRHGDGTTLTINLERLV
jgi:hypothetical protein